MKYKIALLVIMLPIFVLGQNIKDSLAASVINDLVDSWDLGINDDVTQPVDIRVFNNYKILFDSAATVDDEFNVIFRHDDVLKKSTYQLDSNKLFDIYAHDVALQVLKLTIENVSTPKLINKDAKEYVYEISRKVTAEKKRQYVLEDAKAYFNHEITNLKNNEHVNYDYDMDKLIKSSIYNNSDAVYQIESKSTLSITLKFINDSTIKISRIKKAPGSSIEFINDLDQDGVLFNEDSCPTLYGSLTAHGCPDKDFDGVTDGNDGCPDIFGSIENRGCPSEFFNNKNSFLIYTGGLLHSSDITLSKPGDYGYDEVDNSLSHEGSFKNQGTKFSPVFGIEYSRYFGKKAKHFGVSLGFSYSTFNAHYTVEDSIVTTFKSWDGDYYYRRRVTIKKGSEEILTYNVFNVPLLFKYRNKLGDKNKWSYEISAGPSFIYMRNTSAYNARIDFEGLYQTNADGFIYDADTFDVSSDWNVLLTEEDIKSQSTDPGVDSVFNQLNSKGYDFASKKNYTGSDKKATRYSVAFNLNLDISVKLSNTIDMKFGASLVVAPALKSAAHYTPMDKTSDSYNSLYRSNINSHYMSYGLKLGLVYSW